jgi:hypothetical protein
MILELKQGNNTRRKMEKLPLLATGRNHGYETIQFFS